jgi:hypothetical protein
MKAILTLIIILLFGVLAIAQEQKDPAATIGTEDKLNSAVAYDAHVKEVTKSTDTVARIYRFKHSKVYRELSFVTKDNRPKLA